MDLPSAGPIVVVSGLPRSGTSLLMAMLQAGGLPALTDGARRADADNPHGYFELEQVKRLRADAAWLQTAGGHAVKVVFPLLLQLPAGFRYDVLFLERDLGEVVASQIAMLARKGITPPLPAERLEAVFRAQVDQAKASLAARRDWRVLPVSHRALIQRPAEMAAALAQFLGLPLDVPAMAETVDPGLYRQRAVS